MEIQSFAGASRDTLPASTQASRAAVRPSENRPAKGSAPNSAPKPRFRVGDYTAGVQRNTQLLHSTAEQINIEIEP
jgi:hypothetical protein